MISLVTCTGDRPELLNRCEGWMIRQTCGSFEWIIVDDGKKPSRTRDLGCQRYIRREPAVNAHESFKGNLRAALEACTGEFIFIIEDDDWYHPNHIERLMVPLMDFELVGEAGAKYYHVGQRKFRWMCNRNHASLCQTAFRRSLIPTVLRLLNTAFVDRAIWERVNSRFLYEQSITCVGLKGQVGRPGIGVGHRPNGRHWQDDPDGIKLREWIGEDADEVLACGQRPVSEERPAA